MSSIILLRSENQGLEGRIVLSHGGRIFRRDLKPTDDPNALFQDGKPDAIVAAYFSPLEDLALFLEDLTSEHADIPIYLIASDVTAEAVKGAVQTGVKHAFQDPLDEEELLARLCVDTGSSDLAEGLDYEEWMATCGFLKSGSGPSGPESTDGDLEAALKKLEADRQDIELERMMLVEERERIQQAPGPGAGAPVSDELKIELDRRATELEEQRYEFEEQKVFLMDAQREVEAAQMDWEAERAELEKSNEELKQQLETTKGGNGSSDKKSQEGGWLRSTIGSLPLSKGNRNPNGLTASEAHALQDRLKTTTEARRGLEAELEELSRTTAQARAREVELEEEVIDLRRRYERTGGGGVASGGSLIDRLERLAESHTTILSDLDAIRTRRSTLKLQIETLSSELSNQEITEALTPAHLQRIREVKSQRKELQESDAALAAEETRSSDDLERNDQELFMIESWVEELETARTRIENLRLARLHPSEATPDEASFKADPEPAPDAPENSPPSQTEPRPEAAKPRKTRGRKGGLSRRFALRGLT